MEYKNRYHLGEEEIRIGQHSRYPIDRIQRIVIEYGNGTFWRLMGLLYLLLLLGVGSYQFGTSALYLLPGAFYFFWKGRVEDRKALLGLELRKNKYGRETEYIPLIEIYHPEKLERELENLQQTLEKRRKERVRVVQKKA
jgi:hypothetical protein